MSFHSAFRMPLTIAATLATAFIAVAQDAPKGFTARELFYSAGDDSAKPAVKESGKPAHPVVPPPVKRPPANTTSASNSSKPTTPNPPVKSNTTTTTATRVESAAITSPDGSPIIRASDGGPDRAPAPTNGPALGLKITVLKHVGDQDVEVAPNTVFHANDRIQFAVQTNSPGYLYIVYQGSSGTWKPIFPSPDVADGDNHVDGWHSYTMPPKRRMVFDEQIGTEKVFIVFSKEPEAEFENMVYSLPGANRPESAPAVAPTKPASQPQTQPRPSSKEKLVMATAALPNSSIDMMRKTYSRDLIIEKVDDTTASGPAEKKEKALYVVNPMGSNDPRVVADLQLVHQ